MGVFWIKGPGGSSLPSCSEEVIIIILFITLTCKYVSLSFFHSFIHSRLHKTTHPPTHKQTHSLPFVLFVGILGHGWGQTGFGPEVQYLVPLAVASFAVLVRTYRAGYGRTLTFFGGSIFQLMWKRNLDCQHGELKSSYLSRSVL